MTVSFSQIPANVRVPLFYAEMDNSAANSASSTLRRLIVAQVNDNIAPSEVGKLVLVSSVALAKSIGGQGSMLASMTSGVASLSRSVRISSVLRSSPAFVGAM